MWCILLDSMLCGYIGLMSHDVLVVLNFSARCWIHTNNVDRKSSLTLLYRYSFVYPKKEASSNYLLFFNKFQLFSNFNWSILTLRGSLVGLTLGLFPTGY